MCGLLSDEAGFGAYLCEDFIGLMRGFCTRRWWACAQLMCTVASVISEISFQNNCKKQMFSNVISLRSCVDSAGSL